MCKHMQCSCVHQTCKGLHRQASLSHSGNDPACDGQTVTNAACMQLVLKGRYLRQARKHVCMVSLVESYKGQLDAQQLGVGLWQPPTACHKEHKLLLQLNVPAIHNLYSSSKLHVDKLQRTGVPLRGGEKSKAGKSCHEY